MSDPTDIRQASISSGSTKKTVSVSFNGQSFLKIVAVILVVLLAFWLGTLYGNHHHKEAATTLTNGQSGGFGGFGGARGSGGFGTVSSVSSSSISITSRDGSTNTYSITSTTKIIDNGQSSSISSIATGDRVIITPSSSGSTDAGTIIVNPSFGGGYGGSAPQPGGSSTSGGSASGSVTNQ